jgi:hypothetical protein
VNLFSIWPSFGFRENPYSNENLPGDEVGDRLLVGRQAEVGAIQRAIGSEGVHPTIEGPAGVGKSSLIAVAGFRMLTASVDAANGTVFVPTTQTFQASESPDEFQAAVYREVAQTLIARIDAFRQAGVNLPDVRALDRWLNDPLFRSGAFGFTPISAGSGVQPNEAQGFLASGFPAAVRDQLERCFPGPGSGGIICVLDNLELLQSSRRAREVLEQLRDPIFNLRGLRWILCGSRGIVSRARSQRLSGVFAAPTIVPPLPDDDSIELVSRRIREFGDNQAYAPVPPEAFQFLYQVLNRNLRDAMAWAQQFSDWVYAEYISPNRELPAQEDLLALIEIWLAEAADRAHADARGVRRRVWLFFDQLAEAGGTCRASEWEAYGFTTQQQLGSSVTALADANLVVRETDPDNAARSLATITPQGWIVYFHRNRYQLPSHLDGT